MWSSDGAFARALSLLSVTYLALDDFLNAAGNAVHSLDPLPLRLPLQIFGYALSFHHLLDDEPITVLRLLVEVGKVDMQLARQGQMIEQKWVRFFQLRPVHPPPFPDRTVIVLRQFNGRDVIVANKDVIKTVGFVMDCRFQFAHHVYLHMIVWFDYHR